MGQCWTKSCNRTTTISDSDSESADLEGGNVRIINTMELWEKETSEANKDGKIVVVNFSASWCQPCRQIAPTYHNLSEKYSSVLFLTVDVDELAEFCNSWDIKATPTFFFLREGRHLDKLIGANKLELQKKTSLIAEINTKLTPH